MRILVSSVLLCLTAACTAPPQAAAPGSTPTASAIAAVLGPPTPAPAAAPAPIALVPAPVPALAAAVPGLAPVSPFWVAGSGSTWLGPVPVPFSWMWGPEPGGRLTLNNFSYDEARVQVVLTNRPDCAAADPAATGDLVMPLNATRIIPTPPGFDICWRREAPPAAAAPVARAAVPDAPGWADWNRAYTSSGRFIDMRL